jgi:S1-C subfamily serine protease
MRQGPDTFTFDEYGEGVFWTSTVSIQPGWSGSPVVAEDGAVVGVFVACERSVVISPAGVRCRSEYSIFSPLTSEDSSGRP